MLTVSVSHIQKPSVFYLWAERMIKKNHYLHCMPDPRTSFEVFLVGLARTGGNLPFFTEVGFLIFDRPEAQYYKGWFGNIQKVNDGLAECTSWQVLNLARVWIDPAFQTGGEWCRPDYVPGYVDRKGIFRSTLASDAIRVAETRIGFEYLLQRPPVFLDEPYEIQWLMSYCDLNFHRGTIYKMAGFEPFMTKNKTKITWRKRLPPLNEEQHKIIQETSRINRRAQQYRSRRAQLKLEFINER